MPQTSICVFCGARSGEKPIYRQAAEELGQALVQNNWRLVYGAGDIGLMGAVARATQAEGGATLGVIPTHLMQDEVAKTDLATNMGMCGAIAAVLGMPDLVSLGGSVKDRFIGKGIVVSGGTAALDSAIEKKFAKKAKLLEANMRTLYATYKYVMGQGWAHPDAELVDEEELVASACGTVNV